MIRIEFQVQRRIDAIAALRRQYAGCVLLDRDYGFEMLIPERRDVGNNVTIADPNSVSVAMIVLQMPAAHRS
jgi:hypothetical protein